VDGNALTAYAILVDGEPVATFLLCPNVVVSEAVAAQENDPSELGGPFVLGLLHQELLNPSEASEVGLRTALDATGGPKLNFLVADEATERDKSSVPTVADEAGESTVVVEGETSGQAGSIVAGSKEEEKDSESATRAKAMFASLASGVYIDAEFDNNGTTVHVIAIGELKE